MSVFLLDKNEIWFPEPTLADPDGLLAVGGDLSVDRLILAYTHGIFPWYNEGDDIMWWCPHERYVIRPANVHVSHSVKKFMKKHEIEFMLNRDFADTIHRCRLKREFKEGTWIHDAMEEAYGRLHEKGYALAFEASVDGIIAGGLYGVCLGRCFFGESMYSDSENGSKLALIALAGMLETRNFIFIDCQFHTDHLESMGGEMISYEEYMKLMEIGLGT
ncbi:MAG: leucyl/phenylalanyl-tRNA--protein transferase [Lachnospiraceae bacterium]|nr:leucyl/phenylalanyl-tRNA--protein transferase [Lachnospiraceae bacterium]